MSMIRSEIGRKLLHLVDNSKLETAAIGEYVLAGRINT